MKLKYIIGVGNGGCNIVNNIAGELSFKKILIKNNLDIDTINADYSSSYIICSLGGDFGSNAIVKIVEKLKKLNSTTEVIVTTPLLFEGKHRIKLAKDAIEILNSLSVKVNVIDNNKLLTDTDSSMSMADSFGIIDNQIKEIIKNA